MHPERARLMIMLVGFAALFFAWQYSARAQGSADGWTSVALNMRAGPGRSYDMITKLPARTALILEARSADAGWLLGYTLDGQARGWVASAYLNYRDGFDAPSLPVSVEIVGDSPVLGIPAGAALAYEALDLAEGADLVRARAALIDLTAYPVIPASTGQAGAIFRQGQGRADYVVAKVGDCNSIEWYFLHPFGLNEYDLGDYTELQGVVDYFSESFAYRTYAAHNGLNASAVLDPTWADPSVCPPGETPLACEYRLHNPAVAIIMFGTNDMVVLTAVQFDHALRRVVVETMQAGVIPVLSTFPRHLSFPDRSILFNQIVVRVALDYNIPLVNLWLALEPLPAHGIAEDGFHLSGPLTRAGDLSRVNLQTGYPMRNLVTLQALDMIWREVIQK